MSDTTDEETSSVKELGKAEDLSSDELLRTIVGQMFENDNDTSTLTAVLKSQDGVESVLEFEIRITSINGTKTRPDETPPVTEST